MNGTKILCMKGIVTNTTTCYRLMLQHYMFKIICRKMSNDDCFLSNFGGLREHSLHHVLNNNNIDSLDGEPMTFKHSSYIDDDELIYQLKTKSNTFTILSLNFQSQCKNLRNQNTCEKVKIQSLFLWCYMSPENRVVR